MSFTRPLGIRTNAVNNWTKPVVDERRLADWSAYVARLHAAIVRVRLVEGHDGGTLGSYLYLPLTTRWRRSA